MLHTSFSGYERSSRRRPCLDLGRYPGVFAEIAPTAFLSDASTAEEAFQQISATQTFDVVILDLGLPDRGLRVSQLEPDVAWSGVDFNTVEEYRGRRSGFYLAGNQPLGAHVDRVTCIFLHQDTAPFYSDGRLLSSRS
jgi:hypothetical protein